MYSYRFVNKRNDYVHVWTPPRRVVIQIGDEEVEENNYQIALTETETERLIKVLQEAIRNVEDYT